MPLLILTYHQVGSQFDPRLHFRTTWTDGARFRANMELLAATQNVVSVWDGIEALAQGSSDGLQVALSFDDGYASIVDAAAVLEELGLPATFFINSAYVETGEAHWYAVFKALQAHPDREVDPELEEAFGQLRRTRDVGLYRETTAALQARASEIEGLERMFVGWDFLRGLDGERFHVALHGHEHHRFSMMDPAWQAAALDKNLEALADLPAFRLLFAVPFGRPLDWTAECFQLCRARSLRVLMSDGGLNRRADPVLYRVPADNLELAPLLSAHPVCADTAGR